MKGKIFAGTTSNTIAIYAGNTAGGGLGSLLFNTAGLVGEYRRQGSATWTSITLATATLGTFASGGFIADGSLTGAYEVGIPDAAFAAGAKRVWIRYYGAASMVPVLLEFELDQVNYQDAVKFGLTNLDATVSSRSTYAGADTAGTTTLLTRVPATLPTFPTNFASLGISVAGKINGVVLTDTVTTYTGNTVQTGDNFARLGAPAGASIAVDIATRAAATQIPANFTTATFASAGVFATAALANAPTGGSAPTVAQIRTEMDTNSTKLANLTGPVALASQIPANFTTATFASAGVFATAALVNAPTGGGGSVTLASNGLDAIIVETGLNARQALAIIAAASAGVLAGAAGTSVTIAGAGVPATNRINATVDANGNRPAVTLSVPA